MTTIQNVQLPAAHHAIMGESVLIDKETGRVLWEGGDYSSSFAAATATVEPKISQLLGLQAMSFQVLRATLLSGILLVGLAGFFSRWLQKKVVGYQNNNINNNNNSKLSIFMSVVTVALEWTLFRTPKLFDRWFLICIYILYLIESYTCSTRRFLANAISTSPDSPDVTGIESYIEQLRKEQPVIEWMVQCFHYQIPLSSGLLLPTLWRWIRRSSSSLQSQELEETIDATSNPGGFGSSPQSNSMIRRKVITSRATETYKYKSCIDKTFAGVWKRAPRAADDPSSPPAPFAKIILTKLLVLKNKKAREDYTKQQTDFVIQHGQVDNCAEFSTSIRLPNFKSRLLVERPVIHNSSKSTKLFRLHMFWIFTLIGLTVPYRIWFSDHCDEIRVTVAKELSATEVAAATETSWKGWGFFQKSGADEGHDDNNTEETFQSLMKSLQLYATTTAPASSGKLSINETTSAEEQQYQNATAALMVDVASSFNLGKESSTINNDNV